MKYRITLILSLLYALNIFGQENKKTQDISNMQEDMAVMTVSIFLMMVLLFYTDMPQLYLVNINLIKCIAFLSGKTRIV